MPNAVVVIPETQTLYFYRPTLNELILNLERLKNISDINPDLPLAIAPLANAQGTFILSPLKGDK